MDVIELLRRGTLAVALVLLCAPFFAPSARAQQPESAQIASTAGDNYQLGPGDHLRVQVFGEDDLTGEYEVGANGSISYPLIGEISAQGQTVPQFRDALSTALTRYLLHPNITIEIQTYRPFFILGEVSAPGTYPYAPGLNVMSAVATAGGFSYRANRRRVFIKHASEASEHEYPLTSSTPVLPGDTVRIGERFF